MIEKDLETYVQATWPHWLEPVTKLSSGLVKSGKKFHNFDEICGELFPGEVPESADCLAFTPKAVFLIEFKSGFVQKITRKNYDPKKMECPEIDKECVPYRNLFFDHQKAKRQELLDNLRIKGLESYLTLEKKILPLCADSPKRHLVYVVVIDDDPANAGEDILAELAGEAQVKGNKTNDIRKSLKRLAFQKDAEGNVYCYDEIEVQTAANFSHLLNKSIHKDTKGTQS